MLSLTPLQSWIFILMCTLMLFAIVICIILFIDMISKPITKFRNWFLFFIVRKFKNKPTKTLLLYLMKNRR